MALSAEGLDTNIEVIARIDPAVHCDDDDYKEYLSDLDETHLKLNGDDPTRFVMKKVVPFGKLAEIKKEQVSIRQGGEVEFNIGFMISELRAVLVDIKNPGKGLEFKKDGNVASAKLMEKLEALGITNDLYTARTNAVQRKGASKKS